MLLTIGAPTLTMLDIICTLLMLIIISTIIMDIHVRIYERLTILALVNLLKESPKGRLFLPLVVTKPVHYADTNKPKDATSSRLFGPERLP